MGRKDAHDVESFTKDINGQQQHKAQAQGQSSNGSLAVAAGKNNKPGIITVSHHNLFSGKRNGEAGRGRRGQCWGSKGVVKKHKKSSIEKREKKIKRSEEMEKFVVDMRTQMDSDKRLVVEGEATVEELEALVARKREENNLNSIINLWGQLLADQIQFHIFP
ncbi:hypothetical protein CRYUN_Cryun05aG0073400 [Craigia yunnanensis]